MTMATTTVKNTPHKTAAAEFENKFPEDRANK